MIKLHNKLLIGTSTLFIIPVLYANYKKKYLLSTVTLMNMICSINYWINPIEGFRRNTDLIIAKITGLIYFINGFNNIKNSRRLIGYINLFLLLSCYNCSCYYYNKNSKYWIYYHMAFHTFTIIGKMFVIM
jgi:hypothetical protein